MRWLRRRKRKNQERSESDIQAAAEEFWRGWSAVLPTVSAALGDRDPARFETVVCDLVRNLHPDLQWTIERGERAVYALVLSGQEDPRLRRYTDAWKATAPREDMMWEYHDSVPPVPDPTAVTVNVGGRPVRLADVRVAARVDEERGVVDVAVHHPALGKLEKPQRETMSFLSLDATLGERLAAERLRRVETTAREPQEAMNLLQLRQLVYRVAGVQDERPADEGTPPFLPEEDDRAAEPPEDGPRAFEAPPGVSAVPPQEDEFTFRGMPKDWRNLPLTEGWQDLQPPAEWRDTGRAPDERWDVPRLDDWRDVPRLDDWRDVPRSPDRRDVPGQEGWPDASRPDDWPPPAGR